MLKLKPKFAPRRDRKIKATDENGESVVFDSIAELAKYFDLTRQSVYIALNKGKTLRGCKLERV